MSSDQPNIVFTQYGVTAEPFPTTTQPFDVWWQAVNESNVDSEGFSDMLVITTSEEDCPDEANSTVVFNSQDPQYNANPQDFLEGPLKAGAVGNAIKTNVGPFSTPGWYRLTVTLDIGRSNTTTYACIQISQGSDDSGSQ
jgi:hypothetical protein